MKKEMKNKLPKYWIVRTNNTREIRELLRSYLRILDPSGCWGGDATNAIYGNCPKNGKKVDCFSTRSSFKNDVVELTPAQFTKAFDMKSSNNYLIY